MAAEPVIDASILAGLLGTRAVEIPPSLVRAGMAAAWSAHLIPAAPTLLDLVLDLPLLDTTRAVEELGWTPRHSAIDALRELLQGLAAGAGTSTPPLAPDSLSGRWREVATGIGHRT